MRRILSICLIVAWPGSSALSQTEPEPTLELGIQQVKDGNFQGGIFTLDRVIRSLGATDPAKAKDLSRAHLYTGIAYVGLGQEDPAKAAFREALKYDKDLRLSEKDHSPRVVRVFEAARLEKTKSVLQPPRQVAKKAGIGTAGVLVLVGGALAAGGVLATRGGEETVSETIRGTLSLASGCRNTHAFSMGSRGDVVLRRIDANPGALFIEFCLPGCDAGPEGFVQLGGGLNAPNVAPGSYSLAVEEANRDRGRLGVCGSSYAFTLVHPK